MRPFMAEDSENQKKLMQLFSWMSAAISSHRLYLSHNPYLTGNIEKAYSQLLDLMQSDEALTVFLVGEDVVVNRRRLPNITPATKKFAYFLKRRGIENLAFLPGLEKEEFHQFLRDLSSPDLSSIASRNCIKLGKVELRSKPSDGLGEDSDADELQEPEKLSGQLIQQSGSLTGQEAHELEAQYFRVHR